MHSAFEKDVFTDTTSRDSRLEDTSLDTEAIDRAAEKRLVRKCDIHVVPIVSLLYMFSFMDRINIGNARIQGLEKDLKMKGNNYNIALLVFFVPYILFEVPSNMIIRKVPPSIWLSSIMVAWGIITVCMGVTQSYAGLVTCRFLLGLFEAGFFPGCAYLISIYYKRHELARRLNFFFAAAILAGSFSGLFAYALSNMSGVAGYKGWRWIFIVEGLITIVLAAVSKFLIADWPATAKFLNPTERALLHRRLLEDGQDDEDHRTEAIGKWRAFLDWKTWTGIITYLGLCSSGYSTAFFTPTILRQLGWTAVRAQVMSIPIYLVACFVILLTAFVSDRVKHRYTFIVSGVCIATIGYAILLAQQHVDVDVRYFALYLIMGGGYMGQPLCITWLLNNSQGHWQRSVSAAMQIGLGNSAGIIASNIFIDTERPLYQTGYGVSLGLLWMSAAAATVTVLGCRWENKMGKGREGFVKRTY